MVLHSCNKHRRASMAHRRARCSRVHWCRSPLERHPSQREVECKIAGCLVKALAEEVGGSLAPGKKDCLDSFITKKRSKGGLQRPIELSTMSHSSTPPLASGSRTDLWPGEKMLPSTQAGACHARDETRDRGRSQRHLAGTRFLRTVEYRVHRAGESDGASWNSRPGASHVGNFSTVSTSAGPPGVVASLLSFRTPP